MEKRITCKRDQGELFDNIEMVKLSYKYCSRGLSELSYLYEMQFSENHGRSLVK